MKNRIKIIFLSLFYCSLGATLQAEVVYAFPLNGAEQEIGNMLEWRTASESNSQAFIVEKSTDGTSFQNLGMIEAAGISFEEKVYRFLDINATSGIAFYRLKQLDKDGTTSYTDVIQI